MASHENEITAEEIVEFDGMVCCGLNSASIIAGEFCETEIFAKEPSVAEIKSDDAPYADDTGTDAVCICCPAIRYPVRIFGMSKAKISNRLSAAKPASSKRFFGFIFPHLHPQHSPLKYAKRHLKTFARAL